MPGGDPIVWKLGIRPDLEDAFETYVRQANAVPFDFMTVALSHAERKQLQELCNNYKLYSTSSGPEGERRVLVSSAWKGIDKPLNACIGVGAVGYMVARKDSTRGEDGARQGDGPRHRRRGGALDAAV